jgi:hypothetical protein
MGCALTRHEALSVLIAIVDGHTARKHFLLNRGAADGEAKSNTRKVE